ncbi:MAG: SIS domain-containing protein [Candidatus Gastranaerophilaceae bacterium]
MKEISYINATGYPAGELKHGPIAMLDETMPVLSILMNGSVYENCFQTAKKQRQETQE